MKLAEVFTDRAVARAYRHRPEYPEATFRILSELIVGLITAGAAVHWLDESRAMPRFARAPAPGARLALSEVEEEPLDPTWDKEMTAIVKRYSEVRDYRQFTDVLRLLQDDGWFVRLGETRTKSIRARRTLPEYIEWQHSKATLSRVRLGDRVDAFDAEVAALFGRRGVSFIDSDVVGYLTWGQPVAK